MTIIRSRANRKQNPPFVYISAMRRTGSTLLSETLTQLPKAYIFQEPNLGKNLFHFKQHEIEMLGKLGVDLAKFSQYRQYIAFLLRRLKRLGWRQDYAVRNVKASLMPKMFDEQPVQIGVKEISNHGWQHYLRHFPNMKVVLIGRDPRDIYLSACERNTILNWPVPYEPASFAETFNVSFSEQLALSKATKNLQVSYEEICTDAASLDEVRRFVESPLGDVGDVGVFLSTHAKRRPEFDKHQGAITQKSVGRWRTEKNEKLLQEAEMFFKLLPNYTAFWDYRL